MLESEVCVCKALAKQYFIEKASVGQLDVGEESAIVSSCAVVPVEVYSYIFTQTEGGCKFGCFFSEVHRAGFGIFRFRCVDAPQTDSCVVVFVVADINIDGVTIDDVYDLEGF